MAARKRDYAAEYARQKARAREAGYPSLRSYKAARRQARVKAATTGVGYRRTYTPKQIAEYLNTNYSETGYKFNDKQQHTINYLHKEQPGVFPTIDDNEYWGRYFEGSIYAY